MIQRTLRRFWPVALLFLIVVVFLLPRGYASMQEKSVIQPAPVLIGQATVVGKGVQINWVASSQGSRPIGGYSIERKRGNGDFRPVARVEATSDVYLDNEGKPHDVYRIITEDTSSPVLRSTPSSQAQAAPVAPGSSFKQTPFNPEDLPASTDPQKQAASLGERISHAYVAVETALSAKDVVSIQQNLQTLQSYQQQALTVVPQLAAGQKVELIYSCRNHQEAFRVSMYALPESTQFDSTLVLAGCNALQELL